MCRPLIPLNPAWWNDPVIGHDPEQPEGASFPLYTHEYNEEGESTGEDVTPHVVNLLATEEVEGYEEDGVTVWRRVYYIFPRRDQAGALGAPGPHLYM